MNSIVHIEPLISTWLNAVIRDYTKRFSVEVLPEYKDATVMVSFVKRDDHVFGQTHYSPDIKEGRILVVLNCPVLCEVIPDTFNLTTLNESIAHEFVHLCQYLTGREGIKLDIPSDNEFEEYLFMPEEIEARVLQSLYGGPSFSPAIPALIFKWFAPEKDASDE